MKILNFSFRNCCVRINFRSEFSGCHSFYASRWHRVLSCGTDYFVIKLGAGARDGLTEFIIFFQFSYC